MAVRADNFTGRHCLMTVVGRKKKKGGKLLELPATGEGYNLDRASSQLKTLHSATSKSSPSITDLLASGIVRLGHCIPSSCSETDAAAGLTNFLQSPKISTPLNTSLAGYTLNCHSDSAPAPPLDPSDWFVILVLFTFFPHKWH